MTKQSPKPGPQTPVDDAAAAGASDANANPATEPAAPPAADTSLVSAVGLPLDEFHGKGGEYVVKDGVRRLVG